MNVGQAYLDLYSFPTTTLRGYWIPVIVLACYYWILTIFCFLSTTYVRHDEVSRAHFDMTCMDSTIHLAYNGGRVQNGMGSKQGKVDVVSIKRDVFKT